MAHLPLLPIGRAREDGLDDALYQAHRAEVMRREQLLEQRREEARRGWGERYVDRVHARGKMTARERVGALCDRGSERFEVGLFANDVERFGELKSPCAGVITTFAQVEGRWCMVIANDNTVASGAWWPGTPEKIQRAQTMALRLRLPVVYLVDCSGLFLPEQAHTFAGARGAGRLFKLNSELSAAGVPQIAGVLGDSIAGGGYMPIISDRVYMTEQAYMVIAGAALVKGAKSQQITSLDIGGPEVHVHQSGCADMRVPDDATLLEAIRGEVARLPSSAAGYYRAGVGSIPPRFSTDELAGLVPADPRHAYEIEQVLSRLVDQSLFWELMPDRGLEVVTGVARIGGLYAGWIANRQGLIGSESSGQDLRPAGILYEAGIAKIAAFVRACESDGVPIIWLQDIGGFDIGAEAERRGLLASGSNLIYGNSTATTPMFTVLLRKASGAGYYAMAGMPYDPVVQLSTCLSRLAVMEGRTLAIATYRTRLNDAFEIATDDPRERAAIEQGMREVESRIEGDMDPYGAASRGDTDEIVELSELRSWLAALIEMSYQATGYRRVKNPRIWSLHDLHRLTSSSREAASQAQEAIELRASLGARGDERIEVRSPAVGRWLNAPEPGAWFASGMSLGTLETLGRRVPLIARFEGRAIEVAAGPEPALDHGALMLVLEPRTVTDAASASSRAGEAALAASSDDAKELDSSARWFFRAPRGGRFYLRASPDAEPFIRTGQTLAVGETIGLLEVMKTYSRIVYGGELPARGRITAILVEDEADLSPGDPIVELAPIDT